MSKTKEKEAVKAPEKTKQEGGDMKVKLPKFKTSKTDDVRQRNSEGRKEKYSTVPHHHTHMSKAEEAKVKAQYRKRKKRRRR